MNISFENPDKVNGLLTLTVEEADIKEDVEKVLKDYRKRANFPGFRPGMVPMGIVKKRFGASARMDTVNKLVGEQIYKYLKDNNIRMLGEPLPSEKQVAVDIEKDAPYTFLFDIAVAPEFKAELSADDKLPYYTIKVDKKLVDEHIDAYAGQMGEFVKVDAYDPQQRDMLKGDLRELDDNGATKEGGITVEGAVMMPDYIREESQKALFNNAKTGDIITFNPSKAYPDNKSEVAALLKINKEDAEQMTSDFSYQITEISRFKKAEVGQEMFDKVYGKDVVKDEEDFRKRISETLKPQLQANSDYKLLTDARQYLEKKVGNLTYPDAILKRVMLKTNKDKGEEYVEKNYEASLKQLTWHLIKEQLVAAHDIKINDEDILTEAKQTARMQFAQYGMNNVPEEYLDNYAKEMVAKRENIDRFVDEAIDHKLVEVIKKVVTLEKKAISLDKFNELMK